MKKRGLIKSFIDNKSVIYFVVFIIFLVGAIAYQKIPKQEYPDTTMPACYITIVYPGATPKEMEQNVTKKLEEKIIEINDYYYSKSMIYNSISLTFLVVEPSLSEEEIEERWDKVRHWIEEIKADLPDGVKEITMDTDVMEMPGAIMALSGKQYTYDQLDYYAKLLKDQLTGIDGIKKIEIDGLCDKVVKVDVDIDKLSYYQLALSDLYKVLQAQNTVIPIGAVENDDYSINVITNGDFESIEEIKKVIIKRNATEGEVITLDRVADIRMELEDSEFEATVNGMPNVFISVYFKEDSNIIYAGEEVRNRLEKQILQLPEGLEVSEITFIPETIADSIGEFSMNLIQGIVIVIIVIMLGMGLRNSLIVSLSIPLAIFITFSSMNLLGMKFHMLSLAALVLVLGMLVDNAIVVSDSIQARIDNDENRKDACINGAKEVAIPVLSSTLTTIAAFSPLLMLPAAVGAFIGSIPRIVIISLTASYVIAMLFIPVFAYSFFKKSKQKARTHRTKALFAKLLNHAIFHRWKTIGIAVLLLVLVMILSGFLEKSSYPTEDKNILYINVETEYATDFKKSKEEVRKIEEFLQEQEEIENCYATIGGDFPRFHMSVTYRPSAKNIAQIIIEFDLNKTDRFNSNPEFVDYLQNALSKKITGANMEVKEFEMTGDGSPIQVRLLSEDKEAFREIGQEITDILYNMEGTKNVFNDIEGEIYNYKFNINKEQALGTGMISAEIQNEMNIALMGRNIGVFRDDGKEYDIKLKGIVKDIDDLRNLPLRSSITGLILSLKKFGSITMEPEVSKLVRYDNKPSVTISASPLAGYNAIKIQTELEEIIKNKGYQNIELVSEGAKGKLERSTGDMTLAGLFAIFLVYIILMLQFKSTIQPIIILLTIPLSFIGSILALVIFGQTISIFAMLGFLSLFGVVVNNAIILIDYINGERKNGTDIINACKKAADARFRPVVLSTTTTVLGLLPMALFGGVLFRPMALSFMGGLLMSTILSLIVVPVIYLSVEHRIQIFINKIKSNNCVANNN
ncbi:efflux RND transporter permease subunit [Petroclostridium sp. X23]|uniref:efflux RND transporter permease subunit n=1 Tax=Petroclostridium sp. X23 TaxID=3045146 RepID=UPI0024ACCF58|nr:efflux RND transporter permease subunit [Petroclostridium sp. X23]WHH58699.1 efflux RND transporter permease subunit [Petroclostridium sp. X23]